MDGPIAGVAKHLKGFPGRYGVGRAGSTAVHDYSGGFGDLDKYLALVLHYS
jgi:hypothetical protein